MYNTYWRDIEHDKHVESKLGKTNKCFYVIKSLQKEGWAHLYYLFKTKVSHSVTYALVVQRASKPELKTLQDFLDR